MWRREDDLDKFLKLYSYNKQDVRTELACLDRLMELSPSEIDLWELDYKVNNRGVMCDLASVDKGIAIIQSEQKRLNGEMLRATGGVVGSCTEVQMLGKWIKSQGVEMDGLAKADVLDALAADVANEEADEAGELPPWAKIMPSNVRRALELRQEAAKSSTAKLIAMREKASADGRIRNLHQFHAASTGRWAGRGVQTQNLSRPRLGTTQADIEAMFSMLDNKEMFDLFYGPSMAAISDCIRGMLIAGEGNELVACDFSQIEARALPWLAGQDNVLEVFRTHGKIYEHAASGIYHIPMEEVNWFQRLVGKVSILACVAEDTLVLTSNGYKAIVEVTKDDLLWDGVEWTRHEGLIARGYREVINLDGLQTTPDHLINVQGSWQQAKTVVSSECILSQALETGSVNLPSLGSKMFGGERVTAKKSESSARAERSPILFLTPISEKALPLDVTNVQKKRPDSGEKTTGATRTLCLTTLTGEDYSAGYPLASIDAITPTTAASSIMALGASTCTNLGAMIAERFSSMLSRLKDGMSHLWSWTGPTLTRATNQATYASLQEKRTWPTEDTSARCKTTSSIWRPVFDILNAGSRNCFLVKTNSGHMLVHNCGYGGATGAFQSMARNYDVKISDEEALETVKAWREANRKTVAYWYALERAALDAMQSSSVYAVGPAGRQVKFRKAGSFLWMLLPSGRALCYPYPEIRTVITPWGAEKEALTFMTVVDLNQKAKILEDPNSKGRWRRVSTHGGPLAENATQGFCRDLLATAMVAIEAEDIPIVFHVHDEPVAEVEKFRAQHTRERMTAIMSTTPSYAPGLPLAAEAWHGRRYRKG
jgi:DNA polymerase